MATRLYVNGLNEEQTEALLSLPKGTHAKLAAHDARKNEMSPDAWYQILFDDGNEDINSLHNFQLFGFGRLTRSMVYSIERWQNMDTVCGGVGSDHPLFTDLVECVALKGFDANILAQADGFGWS